VTVIFKSWTDDRIVLSGFGGGYGEGYWRLSPHDRILVGVWNAQSGIGPAMKTVIVKRTSR